LILKIYISYIYIIEDVRSERYSPDWKNLKLKPVYWAGSERKSYYIGQADAICRNTQILSEADAGFNLTVFYMNATSAVINACRRLLFVLRTGRSSC